MHEIEMFVSNRIVDKTLTARVTNILIKNGVRTKKDLLNKFSGYQKADISYLCNSQINSCGKKCAKEISNLVEMARSEKDPEETTMSIQLLEQLQLTEENLNAFKKLFEQAVTNYHNNPSQTAIYKVKQAAESLYISYDRYTTLESLI